MLNDPKDGTSRAEGPEEVSTFEDIRDGVFQRWNFVLLIVVVLFITGATLYLAKPFLLPVAAAFVLSVLLAPAMAALERVHIPSGVAALGLVGALCAIIYFAFSFIAQPATHWVQNAPQYMEQASEKISQVKEPISSVQSISEDVKEMTTISNKNQNQVVVQAPQLAGNITSSMGRMAVQTLFVLALTYFLLATRKEMRLKLIAARRTLGGRLHTARMFRDVEHSVGSYIFTMTLINIGLGCAVATAMYFLDVPRPIMWGGIAAAMNFVPYIGPIITASLLAVVGLINADTIAGAAIPPIVYLGLNFIEGSFVTPFTLGKRLILNPLAILLAVSFWTWLWGPVGALLAVPLLVMLKALSAHTEILHPMNLFIGGPIPRPEREGHKKKAAA